MTGDSITTSALQESVCDGADGILVVLPSRHLRRGHPHPRGEHLARPLPHRKFESFGKPSASLKPRHRNQGGDQKSAVITQRRPMKNSIQTTSPPHPQDSCLNGPGAPLAARSWLRRRWTYLGYGGPQPR